MTSPEYQAPTWVNEDDPDFIEGVSPDLGAGYLNQLSGAVEDHGQRLGAIGPVVNNLQNTALDQTAGDNRYILQTNANAFAQADATTTALAGKQPLDADLTALAGLDSATAGTVASDGAGWVKKTYAQMRTALGLATIATSGKLADTTDLATTGAAVDRVPAVATVDGGGVPTGYSYRTVAPVLVEQTAKTSAYTAAVKQLVPMDTTSAAVVTTLPAIPATGDPVHVATRWDSGANPASVAAVGGDKIGNGSATTAVLQLPGETVTWQGTPGGTVGTGRWRAVSGMKPQDTLEATLGRKFARLAGTEGHVLTSQNKVQVISTLATGTSRVPYKMVTAGSDVRLLFTNYNALAPGSGAGDLDNATDITISSTIELDGVFYKVTFSGQGTRTIIGGGAVMSDPIGLDLAAGTWLWVRTFVTVTGTACPANRVNYTWDAAPATGGGGYTATTDLTTSGTIADAATFLYGPSAIYGVSDTDLPHIVGVGDSIMAGRLDGNGEGGHIGSTKGGGWFERAMADQRATINIARGGETGANFVLNANHFRRARFITPGCWVVEAYGRNDLGAGATLAAIQAARIAVWTMATRRGAKIAAATVTPVTTSTDSWATTANQAIANTAQEAVRVPLNQWLRDGAPMLSGAAAATGSSAAGTVRIGQVGHPVSLLLDVSTAIETAQDSGIWKAGFSKDGTHPKNLGYAAMAAVVTPSVLV